MWLNFTTKYILEVTGGSLDSEIKMAQSATHFFLRGTLAFPTFEIPKIPVTLAENTVISAENGLSLCGFLPK